MADIALEVCVDDVAGLESAIEGGADRIELCSALEVGGLTPSAGLMSAASRAPVPVYAMIRPRGGDFVYSQREIDVMCEDIQFAASSGLAGVVFGANLPSGALDIKAIRMLANAVGRMPRTLHRAFDLAPDLAAAVETAVDYDFERILTSGRAARVPDGLDDLAEIVRLADGRISIMPGSGVNADNVDAILGRLPGVREVHASCSKPAPDAESRIAAFGFSSGAARVTDADMVRALKSKLTGR